MGRYMRPVLSSWVLVTLYAEESFAAVHYALQPPFSENAWSVYSSANDSEWEGTQGSEVGALATSSSSIVTLEESRQSSAIDAPGTSDAENSGARGLIRTGKAGFSPFTVRNLSSSLALFFVLSLLTVCLKNRMFPKEEEVPVTEEPVEAEEVAEGEQLVRDLARRAQTEERLKKVKALLPAAERLASAIGTADSVKLLTVVQGVVRAADWKAGAADNGKLEEYLKRALGALRRLHEAGIDRGNEILKANKTLPTVPPLGAFARDGLKVEFDWQDGLLDNTVAPFAMAYQAVYESAARLSKRFSDAGRRLAADRRFENEEDGQALVNLTLVIDSLRTTGQDFQHLSSQATILKDGIHCGIQAWLLADHESALVTIEGDLRRYRMYVESARDALRSDAAAQLHSVDEIKAALGTMEKNFEEVESLVDQIKAEIWRLRRSPTLVASVGITDEASALRNQAEEVLQKCSTDKELFASLVSRLSPSSLKVMDEMAENYVERVKLVNERVRKITGSAQLSLKKRLAAHGVGGLDKARYLKEDVFTGLLEGVHEVASQSEASVTDAQASQKRIKRSSTLPVVLEETAWLGYIVRSQEGSLAAALSALLRVQLADFCEDDVKVSERAVGAAELLNSHLTETEKQQYAEALGRFNAARKAAKEADTLEEASEAVGQMRQHAIAVSDIVYRYTAGDSQLE